MNKISSQEFCQNFVRANNYNLYLLHFFAPRKLRRTILSLMALHCELKSIPQKAQDPMMILIRLKWWSDALLKLKTSHSSAQSPILEELAPLIHSDTIPQKLWDDYFNRFEQSFSGQPSDIDAVFYDICALVIPDNDAKNKFIKKIIHHDILEDKNFLRAIRLWFEL